MSAPINSRLRKRQLLEVLVFGRVSPASFCPKASKLKEGFAVVIKTPQDASSQFAASGSSGAVASRIKLRHGILTLRGYIPTNF